MAKSRKNLETSKAAVAVVLTFIAGYVDAVGWLGLDRVFTAQMSGNVVLLAVHIVAGEDDHAWLQADTLFAFFAGLVISGSVIEIGKRRHMRRIFAVALAVEFVMLSAFALAGRALPIHVHEAGTSPDRLIYWLIAVLAFAMGAQNTSLRMAGILSVWTTHMTGALSGLSEELIVAGVSLFQSDRRGRRGGSFASETLRSLPPDAFSNIVRSAALLVGFFFGALAGAALAQTAGTGTAMAVPIALVIGVGLFDWIVPLTVFPSPVEHE